MKKKSKLSIIEKGYKGRFIVLGVWIWVFYIYAEDQMTEQYKTLASSAYYGELIGRVLAFFFISFVLVKLISKSKLFSNDEYPMASVWYISLWIFVVVNLIIIAANYFF